MIRTGQRWLSPGSAGPIRRWLYNILEFPGSVTGMFRQSFANQFILFKLLGVNYFCDIWIDGRYVGYHAGGFTCFAFDAPQLLTRAIILLQFVSTILHGIPVIFNIKLFPMGAISSIMVAL